MVERMGDDVLEAMSEEEHTELNSNRVFTVFVWVVVSASNTKPSAFFKRVIRNPRARFIAGRIPSDLFLPGGLYCCHRVIVLFSN